MVGNYKITEDNASGSCPECNHSWDKGDVMDYLKESFPKLSEDGLLKIAKRDYGWTPENPRRFNHLLFIEASDGDYNFNGQSGYYQCPNCNIAWDDIDGTRTEKYKVLMDMHAEMDMIQKKHMLNNKDK